MASPQSAKKSPSFLLTQCAFTMRAPRDATLVARGPLPAPRPMTANQNPRAVLGPRNVARTVLSPSVALALASQARSLANAYPSAASDTHQATRLGTRMACVLGETAPELAATIAEFRRGGGDCYALEAFGFDTSDPLTASAILLGASELLGYPFQYLQQNDGRLVARVEPKRGMEATDSSSGRIEFRWHTDDPIMPVRQRADFVCLIGIENQEACPTYHAAAAEALSELSPSHVARLAEPCFEIGLSDSFHLGAPVRLVSRPCPIITFGENGWPTIAVKAAATRVAANGKIEHELALAALLDGLDRARRSTVVGPGVLFCIDNLRACHGRGRIDGDRLLLRTLVKRDLTGFGPAAAGGQCVFDVRDLLLRTTA